MEFTLSEKLELEMDAPLGCSERSMAGQFALEVMHEVRNPLDALGNLLYLAADARELVVVQEYLGAAKEQIANLYRVADQNLTLARNAQIATSVDMINLAKAAIRVHQRRRSSKIFTLYAIWAERRC